MTDRTPEPADIPQKAPDEQPGWLDGEKTGARIGYALFGLCALLLLIDPLVHKHGKFAIEHVVGFYGLFAVIVGGVLVLAAYVFGKIMRRPEDYYDR